MMSLRRQPLGALAVALLAIPLVSIVVLTGCRKGSEMEVETNLAPNTRLTSAPGPFSQANYRVHLYWEGSDPDGYIVAYYFAWDDTMPGPGAVNSAWQWTTRTDSLFKAVIDTVGETRRHTFYVRSVDNEGMLDPSPARVRFDAWTQTPVVDSLYRLGGPEDPASPDYNPGYKDTVLMGTPCEFVWIGWDPDGLGAPVRFSYRLDSNPFPAFSDATYAMLTDITSRTHFFYVKARDETGAESFPVTLGRWYHVVFVHDQKAGKSILRSNDLVWQMHSEFSPNTRWSESCILSLVTSWRLKRALILAISLELRVR